MPDKLAKTSELSSLASDPANNPSYNADKWFGLPSILSAGVDNTGATDTTTEILAALSSGRSFYFPAGDYLISSTISLQRGQMLVGDGPIVTRFWKNADVDMVSFPVGSDGCGMRGIDLLGSYSTYRFNLQPNPPSGLATFTDTTNGLVIGVAAQSQPRQWFFTHGRIFNHGRDGVSHADGPQGKIEHTKIYYNARWGIWQDTQSNVNSGLGGLDLNHTQLISVDILSNGLGNYDEGGNFRAGGAHQVGVNVKVMRAYGEAFSAGSRKSKFEIHDEQNGVDNSHIDEHQLNTAYSVGRMVFNYTFQTVLLSGITGSISGTTLTLSVGTIPELYAGKFVKFTNGRVVQLSSFTSETEWEIIDIKNAGTVVSAVTADVVQGDRYLYYCTVAGTSAATGMGPSHISSTASDGTVTWRARRGSAIYFESLTDAANEVYLLANGGEIAGELSKNKVIGAGGSANNNLSQSLARTSMLCIDRRSRANLRDKAPSAVDRFKGICLYASEDKPLDHFFEPATGSGEIYRLLLGDSKDNNSFLLKGDDRFYFSQLVSGLKPDSTVRTSSFSNFGVKIGTANLWSINTTSAVVFADFYTNQFSGLDEEDLIGLVIIVKRVAGSNDVRVRFTDEGSTWRSCLQADGTVRATGPAQSDVRLNSTTPIRKFMYCGSSKYVGLDANIRWEEII